MNDLENKIDKEWFPRLKKTGLMKTTGNLWKQRESWEKQKKAFFSGDLAIPDLPYPEINREKLKVKQEALKSLKDDIATKEKNEIVLRSYLPKIDERLKFIKMQFAVAQNNMDEYQEQVFYLYGRPSQEVFDYTLSFVREKAKDYLNDTDRNLQKAARDFLDITPDIKSKKTITLPDKELVDFVHQETVNEFKGFNDLSKTFKKDVFTAKDIKNVYEQALKILGADTWQIVIRPGSGALSVSAPNQAVYIPATRTLPKRIVPTLLLHEIGTHLNRAMNGSKAPLYLLGRGLDHYERAEEGIATVREQAWRGELEDFDGQDSFLAIGLVLGMDGNKRDFRELYDIFEKFLYYKFLKKDYPEPVAAKKAKDWAWYRCLRVFIGTTGKQKGVCFTKDIIYRQGNVKIWQVARDNPEEVKRFSKGKYDPANPDHIWIMNNL